MICSLIRGGNPWPDTNIMQMEKHNNKMASFVVKVQQPLPAQKRSIVQTMHSRSYGRKMKNSLLFKWIESSAFSFFTGDVASAVFCC